VGDVKRGIDHSSSERKSFLPSSIFVDAACSRNVYKFFLPATVNHALTKICFELIFRFVSGGSQGKCFEEPRDVFAINFPIRRASALSAIVPLPYKISHSSEYSGILGKSWRFFCSKQSMDLFSIRCNSGTSYYRPRAVRRQTCKLGGTGGASTGHAYFRGTESQGLTPWRARIGIGNTKAGRAEDTRCGWGGSATSSCRNAPPWHVQQGAAAAAGCDAGPCHGNQSQRVAWWVHCHRITELVHSFFNFVFPNSFRAATHFKTDIPRTMT